LVPNQRTTWPTVAHRGARQEPAELAVRAADRELHVERIAGADRIVPALHHHRQHVRVDRRLPAPADQLLGRAAAVLVPALVEPDDGAVGLRHPGQLRDRIGQRAQQFLALAQGILGSCGADVLHHAGHTSMLRWRSSGLGVVSAPIPDQRGSAPA
jgi:hypothetical protein